MMTYLNLIASTQRSTLLGMTSSSRRPEVHSRTTVRICPVLAHARVPRIPLLVGQCPRSRELIKQNLIKGDGYDIMSVLLRANGASDPKNKMPDDELVDQIACVT
jgi:hypothetical protein